MDFLRTYFSHPLLKWPLLFGLATGVLCFLYFLALYGLGVPPLGNHKSLDFGINIIMMTAAVWFYRRRVGNGMLHLWEALTICYLVNTVGALVSGWLIYFFVTQLDPDVFTRYVLNSKNLLMTGKTDIIKTLGENGPLQFQEMLDGLTNLRPGELITDELAKKSALAVLPVLIISLLFRKQDYSILE
ncbi:MAG: DUF4199 domain-containing protein [Bacteroidetes bacterium]|nr:DUF4199 domain-containing protein [Fibrella sp.]